MARILVVDDDRDIVEVLKRVLEDEDYATETAFSGEEAWQKCQTTRFDVVIADWRMGKISGGELARRLNQLHRHTQVILITAYGERLAKEELAKGHISFDYLDKPVDRDDLLAKIKEALARLPKSLIVTEGKTDWKHLKHALQKLQAKGQFVGLPVEFNEYEEDRKAGDKFILDECQKRSLNPNERLFIYMFDRDNPDIVKEVINGNQPKSWGNNVFSFIIPVPTHRQATPHICLEFYYTDEEITRADEHGRRLYMGEEFNPTTTRHQTEDLTCRDLNKIGKAITLIEAQVFDKTATNIALPKNDFADYVLNDHANFNDFDVTPFIQIFEVIAKIIKP